MTRPQDQPPTQGQQTPTRAVIESPGPVVIAPLDRWQRLRNIFTTAMFIVVILFCIGAIVDAAGRNAKLEEIQEHMDASLEKFNEDTERLIGDVERLRRAVGRLERQKGDDR